jgi:hypothetical protein
MHFSDIFRTFFGQNPTFPVFPHTTSSLRFDQVMHFASLKAGRPKKIDHSLRDLKFNQALALTFAYSFTNCLSAGTTYLIPTCNRISRSSNLVIRGLVHKQSRSRWPVLIETCFPSFVQFLARICT